MDEPITDIGRVGAQEDDRKPVKGFCPCPFRQSPQISSAVITTNVPNESTSPRCNPSAQKSPSTVPNALAINIASQNAGEGLRARALKPKTFAGPAVHVRSKVMIESRGLVGNELNRTRLLPSQEERDASE